MRPLTDDETRAVFSKLAKFIGDNVKNLIDRPDGVYCFRMHRDRVFYVSEKLMKAASHIPRKQLLSFGTCLGKFSKTQKFRLHITSLIVIAPLAKKKVWVKPSAEQQFLYGNHVLKSGLGRITEATERYDGVVVYSMSDVPLGFGVAAKSTADCRHIDPHAIVCLHQADVGEYLRDEATII